MPGMGEDAATDARMWARFFELYELMPRGGPGDPASARRALGLMTRVPARPQILDLGCGPGRGSTDLASLTGGRVVALDLHLPFVASQRAAESVVPPATCVLPVCADMRAAPFAEACFDLVWSEGALYSIGFRHGLEVCRRLVKPDGYVALSEAVWTVPDPPDEIRRWWTAEYPDMGSVQEKTAAVEAAGFDIVDHFTLPPVAWRDYYYVPLRAQAEERRRAWANDEAGLRVIAMVETEIAMYERWGHTYSYEFFVARLAAPAAA
jgi:SAM-dependent methyltransferase